MTQTVSALSSRLLRHHLLAALMIFSCLLIPMIAHSDGLDTTIRQSAGLERTNALSDQDGVQQAGLEMTAFTNSEVILQSRLENGTVLRFGGDLLVTGFPETGSDTEFQTGLNAEAIRNFGTNTIWQGKLKVEADRQVAGADWAFQRARIGVRLRYQPDRHHTTTAHLRFGFRDQNEMTFGGYDQFETLAEISHAWRPWADRRTFTGTLYTEARRAEDERYSYDEVGLRLAARYPISDQTELTGRLNLFDRTYGFDEVGGQRDDLRILSTLTVTYDLTEDLQMEAYAGFDSNRSTFEDRAYQGAVLGVTLTMTFD